MAFDPFRCKSRISIGGFKMLDVANPEAFRGNRTYF